MCNYSHSLFIIEEEKKEEKMDYLVLIIQVFISIVICSFIDKNNDEHDKSVKVRFISLVIFVVVYAVIWFLTKLLFKQI